VFTHSDLLRYLRCKRTVLSELEFLLEIVGREMMAGGVMAGTHSEGVRERIPDCGSCGTGSVTDKSLVL